MGKQINVNNKKIETIIFNEEAFLQRVINCLAHIGYKTRVSLIATLLIICATTTGAAQNGTKINPNTQTPAASSSSLSKASEEYKSSLKELLSSYEREAERLAEENRTLKELYAEGLIARNKIEASDSLLATARAKSEDVRKQIAEADSIPKALSKPSVIGQFPMDSPASAMSSKQVWTTGNAQIDNLIRYYGKQHGVDPYLIYCVMHKESGFRTGATSHKGAQGLMQLMPATAARFGVTNPYNPAQNIMAGTRYLKYLLELFDGRIDLALAGYNAGEGAVIKYGYRIPPYAETKAYVRTISARYTKVAEL